VEDEMATALFTVKATIAPEREQAFNEWYNREHVPDVSKFKGVISARRYKTILPEDRFQYMAVYEFESEETLRRFLESEHLTWLRKEYDAHFGDVSDRQRAAYVQVWP
jgi:antibiotic biosynthesis monooxygenase (ABM) superfamily enzyme